MTTTNSVDSDACSTDSLSTVESSQILQRQLVVDASHELRTPLTSLRTNAQVLSRAQELNPDDLRQLTDDMVTQVDELAALVTDLGELSRGERSEGAIESLRLDECLDECLDTARTYARIKEITIDVHVESSTVLGRRDRLERAISNLLTNAIKFTPQGGRIVVDSRAGMISVGDSGPGIDDVDRPFIFDRFWRSPSARALPGSGLGLSIVAQVVRRTPGQRLGRPRPDARWREVHHHVADCGESRDLTQQSPKFMAVLRVIFSSPYGGMRDCVLRRSMTPAQRTPQQRDRRFARVRHVTQVIFLGSCAASALFVGYAANAAKVTTTSLPTSTPSTTSGVTTTEAPTTTSVTTTTIRRTPTTTASDNCDHGASKRDDHAEDSDHRALDADHREKGRPDNCLHSPHDCSGHHDDDVCLDSVRSGVLFLGP